MISKKYFLFVCLLLFLIPGMLGYSYSKYQYLSPGISTYRSENFLDTCEPGQDFILQIAPRGCSPEIVPSALLEEQDVTIMCQIEAYKVNPLIDVKMIKDLSITGKYPPEVKSVGFFPSRAAIDRTVYLDDSFSNNIGYVVITLRKQSNASAVKEIISGNLSAKILYDIEASFGSGKSTHYIPVLGDAKWEETKGQYAFWNKKAYLKVNEVDSASAKVEIYQGDKKIGGTALEKGEESSYFYIPGAGCAAGFQLRLDGVAAPKIRAKIQVNEEILELQEGDTFADGKCVVNKIEKVGILEKVKITCREDNDGKQVVELVSSPRVKLKIDGFVKEVGLGEQIYSYKLKETDEKPNRFVYLDYLQDKDIENKNKDDLKIEFVVLNEDKSMLDASDMKSIKRVSSKLEEIKETTTPFVSTGGGILGLASNVASWFATNIAIHLSFQNIEKGKTESSFGGVKVEFVGLADPQDIDLNTFSSEAKQNYDAAIRDYDLILSTYPGTKYPDNNLKTKGQEALIEKIVLMNHLGLKKTVGSLCEDYEKSYGDFPSDLDKACNVFNLASSEASSVSYTINKKPFDISLREVYSPDFEEAGAVVYFRDGKENIEKYELEFNDPVYIDDKGSFIKLTDLSKESAKIEVYLGKGVFTAQPDRIFSETGTLKLDEPNAFSTPYSFTLDEINLEQYAKITVLPRQDKNYGVASFRFNVAVEKRAIELSPTQIKNKIESTKETIAKLEKISNNLGTVVDGLNTACMATGAYYTLKTLFKNAFFSKGEGIARGEVMTWWNTYCKDKANWGTDVQSEEGCLLKHSDEINIEVGKYQEALNTQNEFIKAMQKDSKYLKTSSTFGNVLNGEKLKEDYLGGGNSEYRKNLLANLIRIFGEDETIEGRQIIMKNFVGNLSASKVSMDQLKSLELNSKLSSSSAKAKLISLINEISKEQDVYEEQDVTANIFGVSADKVLFVPSKNSKVYPLSELRFENVDQSRFGNLGIDSETYVEVYNNDNGEKYLLVLELNAGRYVINKAYEESGRLFEGNLGEKFNFYFEKYDASSYENKYLNPKLRYYEKDPYKGLPGLVPFDFENGWYAAIKSTTGTYDESGKVNSFYLCNVGRNGLEEDISGDDECRGFNLATGQTLSAFNGLSPEQTKKKVDEAVNAIEAASKAYKSGISKVKIGGRWIEVGEPKTNNPVLKCTDFLSPKECQVWFNVCDPVLCPSSRCDFGGKYPVDNVIQSGIIGSLALCLPNYEEGIYLPVCLSGLDAGLNSFIAVYKNYQSCLEENLKTGKVVGVCDEIQSIYLCKFFWEQAIPLTKLGSNLFTQKFFEEGVRGGGEYLEFSSAFDSARKSYDFFTQEYATGSTSVFNSLDTTDFGGEFCKAFVSGSFPSVADITNRVGKLDSPVQFYGKFEEESFNTAVNPPISYYSVTYSIYAGENEGGYYQVYLQDDGGSSYYQNFRSRVVVDSGYLPLGEAITEKKDFTDVSGYRNLCIAFNEEYKCGFKQVTTDFGTNYLKDQYVKSQVEDTNIKTEKECISGTNSIYSLANTNLQSGVENFANPNIAEYNIIRVCATSSPGKGSDGLWDVLDQARWRQVGYCDSENMGCWLDTKSLDSAFEWKSTLNDSLIEVNAYTSAFFKNQTLSDVQFQNLISNLDPSEKSREILEGVIQSIDGLFDSDKIFLDFQKAHLYFLRGKAYGKLSTLVYDIKNRPTPPSVVTPVNLNPGDAGYGGSETSLLIFKLGNFFYGYWNNGWHVSEDNSLWVDIEVFEQYQSTSFSGGTPAEFSDELTPEELDELFVSAPADATYAKSAFDNFYEEISPREFSIISDLNGKTFEQGIEIITNSVLDKSFDSVSVGNVKFNQAGIFIAPFYGKNSNFKFEDNGWRWYLLGMDDWHSVSETKGLTKEDLITDASGESSGIQEEIVLNSEQKTLLNFLNKSSFLEGSRILFSLGSTNLQTATEDETKKFLNDSNSNDINGILGDIENELKCEDCGEDKHWYTLGFGDKCTKDQCLAIGKKLGITCIYEGKKCITAGTFQDRSEVTYNTQSRTEIEVKRSISGTGTAEVNSACLNYARVAVEAAAKYSTSANTIDPLMIIAIMQQESGCGTDPTTYTAYCPGVMQICSISECKDLGISSKDDLRNSGSDNKNIACGAEILAKSYGYYSDGHLIFQGCSNKNIRYYGWEAALRGYNGWGCDEELKEQDNYVESIIRIYNFLVDNS